MNAPKHRCVRVANLRRHGYSSLREWISTPGNLYVGRHGRIFINGKIFHYPGRKDYQGLKWRNPFKVGAKHHSLNESLKLYEAHLRDSGLIDKLGELSKYKELGCFCTEGTPCHAALLVCLLEKQKTQ